MNIRKSSLLDFYYVYNYMQNNISVSIMGSSSFEMVTVEGIIMKELFAIVRPKNCTYFISFIN